MNNDEAEVLAEERELRAENRESTLESSVTMIKWLVVVLIVLSAGALLRSFVNQDSTDKAKVAAETAEDASIRAENTSIESRDASLDTLHQLEEIVAQLEEANAGEPELQNQAIIDALAAVARIEGQLCGGPCPEPEP